MTQVYQVPTLLGQIVVNIEKREDTQPVVFMHGVFLDKTLWKDCDSTLTGCTHVYIDMPAHGESSNVGRSWTLDECTTMLTQVLDFLKIEKCVLVGHSWGSMTALRAAVQFPERFAALCLFNMPFKKTSGAVRIGFQFQKLLTRFQRFYARQAAQSLYSKAILEARPELIEQMQSRLAARPGEEISRVISAVILDAEDATQMIKDLNVPALFVVGELDYVGVPPGETITVPGGHISPHEAPSETKHAILRVVELAAQSP